MKKKQKSSSSPQLPALDDSGLIKMDNLEVNKLDVTIPLLDVLHLQLQYQDHLQPQYQYRLFNKPLPYDPMVVYYVVADYLCFLYLKGPSCSNL